MFTRRGKMQGAHAQNFSLNSPRSRASMCHHNTKQTITPMAESPASHLFTPMPAFRSRSGYWQNFRQPCLIFSSPTWKLPMNALALKSCGDAPAAAVSATLGWSTAPSGASNRGHPDFDQNRRSNRLRRGQLCPVLIDYTDIILSSKACTIYCANVRRTSPARCESSPFQMN